MNAPKVVRFDGNPIITPDMLDGADGVNINGPSLIRVPPWLPDALGRYYLYFAHHGGAYIRMAYADHLHGPWKVLTGGTLRLEQAPCERHIASPDVHVDDELRRVRMYYHGVVVDASGRPISQCTFVATSADGIHFDCLPQVLGPSYFRVFRWGGMWWPPPCQAGFSPGPPTGWRPSRWVPPCSNPIARTVGCGTPPCRFAARNSGSSSLESATAPNASSCLAFGWRRTGIDGRIRRRSRSFNPKPSMKAAALPVDTSRSGPAPGPVHELRDPAIYEEQGRTWLLYSVAGESGIAIAELRWPH